MPVPTRSTGDLAVAVTSWPDFDFTGAGEDGGRYVLTVNSYHGTILAAGDDTSTARAAGAVPSASRAELEQRLRQLQRQPDLRRRDADFTETVPELLARAPRIAPLWDDLDAPGRAS